MEISIGQDKTRAGQVAEILTSAILRIQAKRNVDGLFHRGGSRQRIVGDKLIDIDQFIDRHVGQRAQ